MPTIELPDPSLVVLVGAAGAGKTTFARRWFGADEILSSDTYRERLTGDEADQRGTKTAFSLLHRDVVRRLAAGRLTVVDATNVERHARRALVSRARIAAVPAVAIVFALPRSVVLERNAQRTGRVVDPSVVDRHLERLALALGEGGIATDGFRAVHLLGTVAEVDDVVLQSHRPGA